MEGSSFLEIPIQKGELVIGRDSLNYQKVLDDFCNAKIVRILTYNISKNPYNNKLMHALETVSAEADVKVITNIPSRMPTYYNSPGGEAMKNGYRNNFSAYLRRLNPENFRSNPEVLFNFTNHAKIIGTENIVYIGSANYSDESAENIESGTIISDKDVIERIYNEFFPAVLNDSIPYFEDDFNVFRLFALSMKAKFSKWLFWFNNNLIWENLELGIRGVCDSFELDEDGLFELHSDIEELNDFIVHVENTYSDEDDEYNELVEKIIEAYNTINVTWMADFTMIDSELFELVTFSEEKRISELLQDDFDAYDENLDACVEEAMDMARDEYLSQKASLEKDVFFLRDQIYMVVQFLDRAHYRTLQYADKWIVKKLDNTK